jgi:transcriptional regulator with XRE-family HTH domain
MCNNCLYMFNDWLLDRLKEKGWSQSELARKSGLTTASISNYINGRIPDKTALRKISKALGIPPIMVFEQAGLLPSQPGLTPSQQKLLYASTDMPASDIDLAIQILETRAEYYIKNPSAKPKE